MTERRFAPRRRGLFHRGRTRDGTASSGYTWAPRSARRLLPPYTRTVIQQDVRIMEVQTRKRRRFGARRFSGTAADEIHRAIEALRHHAAAGEQGPPPEPISTGIEFWM